MSAYLTYIIARTIIAGSSGFCSCNNCRIVVAL